MRQVVLDEARDRARFSRLRRYLFGDKVREPVKIAGMACQNPKLLPWRKVVDNVLLPLEIVEPHRHKFRREREHYRAAAEALLKTVGLDGFGERFPWELSGGMQQRVSLCRALIHQPALLAARALADISGDRLPPVKNSFVTLWTTLAGFALAVAFGIVLGIIVGWSRTIYRGLYPVMIGFNSIPKVAVVPILIIWFGIGVVPAVL